eukprot:SAG31_NODE_8474_length_1444_cov_13.220998_1_plen_54_part_00
MYDLFSIRFGRSPSIEQELEHRAMLAAVGEDFGVAPSRLEQMCRTLQSFDIRM